MNKPIRDFVVPVAVGVAIHIAIYQSLVFLSPWQIVEPTESPGRLTIYIYPWLNLLLSILPGSIAGALSTRIPMLNGFLAAFIGQLFIIFAFQTQFFSFSPHIGVLDFMQHCLIAGAYGLVSGAAGFMIARPLTTP